LRNVAQRQCELDLLTWQNVMLELRTLIALAGHSNMTTTQRYIDMYSVMLKAIVELV